MKAKTLLLLVPSALMLIGCNGDIGKSNETPDFVETDLAGARARLKAIDAKVNAADFVLPTKGLVKKDAKLKTVVNSSTVKEATVIQNVAFDLNENDPYLHSFNNDGEGEIEETWLYKDTSGEYIAAYDTSKATVDESGSSTQTNTKTYTKTLDSTSFMADTFNPAADRLEVDENNIKKLIKETPSSILESLDSYEQWLSSSAVASDGAEGEFKFYLGKGEGDIKVEATETMKANDGTLSTIEMCSVFTDYMLSSSYVSMPIFGSSMVIDMEYKWGEVEKTYPTIADFTEVTE